MTSWIEVEFDTIYHEHLFYYSVTSLVRLFAANGLEMAAVERIPMHGGSLRVFAQPRAAPRPSSHPWSHDARRGSALGVDSASVLP